MKAIIIAAGPCQRLRPLTDNKPKCMLEIKGKPLIQNTLEAFRTNGIKDISVIRGYKKEKINFEGLTYFDNDDFANNNILHSFMHARAKLEEAAEKGEDVIATYADIWYSEDVVKKLVESKKPISSIVDVDWQEYYEGRSDHPEEEAENIILDENQKIKKIGKHVSVQGLSKNTHGEFIGLWKFTPEGVKTFLKHFDRINSTLNETDPFQHAREWRKSYITDIFQELVDQGEELHCVLIKKNWMEFDTVQDYERIKKEIGGMRK